jgi:hypothetical protein
MDHSVVELLPAQTLLCERSMGSDSHAESGVADDGDLDRAVFSLGIILGRAPQPTHPTPCNHWSVEASVLAYRGTASKLSL